MARFLSIDGEMLSGASACLGLGLDLFADTEAADQLAQLAGLAPQVRRRGRGFFNHGGVLLRDLVHLVDGGVYLGEARGLFALCMA